MKSRTTWRSKLEKEAEIVDVPPRWQQRYGRGKMLIPRPLDVDALIRKVPAGKLVTVGQIREKLAQECHVEVTCPLTTGIFVRIVAEAAEETLREGSAQEEVTPYWRVVKEDGSLNEKFPGGVEKQASWLQKEGHIIERPGARKRPRVSEVETSLVVLVGGNVVVKTRAWLTCPECNYVQEAEMPRDSCQFFYQCLKCKKVLRPKQGDCCVFCSYADLPCPPKQLERAV